MFDRNPVVTGLCEYNELELYLTCNYKVEIKKIEITLEKIR